MNIPFLDMKAPYQELKKELDNAYLEFMESGYYVLGGQVSRFEKEYAEFCGTAYCASVSNGLDAIMLALKSAGVKKGDEVIVPANTYIATWLAVSHLGARPVPVEPVPSTFNIDPEKIVPAITQRTKAIIPVHLYGKPADMDSIMKTAEEHQLIVIEDNAQAQGAFYKDRRTGNLGHLGAVSFYPGKNLGAFGEAGGVTSNNLFYIEKIKKLRNYGSQKKYYNEMLGYNMRMDTLQAAFLSVKLKKLDQWNQRRKKIAARYLEGIMGVELPGYGVSDSVWHQFIIRVDKRESVQKKLADKGVQTMIHYPIPPHLSQAYQGLGYKKGDFPLTEKLSESVLSLPIGPHMNEKQVDYVVESINGLS